jgi:phosphatidylglycerol:prolipoprotein diacylglycerol transferase
MGYGTVRFGIEFFREPDPHLMYVLGPFTMGQVLCAAMVLVGLAAYGIGRRAAMRVGAP